MNRTAFLVEDNPIVRDNLTRALREMVPMDVVGWAGDEDAALRWLDDPGHARCDLVIVDLFIADGSGLVVLEALAGRAGGSRVVVLTNYVNPEMTQRCLQLGADRVFDKSHDLEALIDYCAELDAEAAPALPFAGGAGATG